MRGNRARTAAAAAVATAILGGAAWLASAQTPAAAPEVKRNIVLRQDTAVPGREVLMASVEFPPGSSESRHIHPAAEVYAFVEEGSIRIEIEGQPTRTVKVGDVFTVPQGRIHVGTNSSAAPARLSVVFLAEKGKPLVTPAP